MHTNKTVLLIRVYSCAFVAPKIRLHIFRGFSVFSSTTDAPLPDSSPHGTTAECRDLTWICRRTLDRQGAFACARRDSALARHVRAGAFRALQQLRHVRVHQYPFGGISG